MYILLKLTVKTQVVVADKETEFSMSVVHATNTPQPFIDAGAEILMTNSGDGYSTEADAYKAHTDYLYHLETTYGRIGG